MIAAVAALAAGCGGSDGGSGAASTERQGSATENGYLTGDPKKLTLQEGTTVAGARVAISRYCLQALRFVAGRSPNPPSSTQGRSKDRSVERLIEVARAKPEARLSGTRQTMKDVLIEAISTLERCEDRASARRLELTLETLR